MEKKNSRRQKSERWRIQNVETLKLWTKKKKQNKQTCHCYKSTDYFPLTVAHETKLLGWCLIKRHLGSRAHRLALSTSLSKKRLGLAKLLIFCCDDSAGRVSSPSGLLEVIQLWLTEHLLRELLGLISGTRGAWNSSLHRSLEHRGGCYFLRYCRHKMVLELTATTWSVTKLWFFTKMSTNNVVVRAKLPLGRSLKRCSM